MPRRNNIFGGFQNSGYARPFTPPIIRRRKYWRRPPCSFVQAAEKILGGIVTGSIFGLNGGNSRGFPLITWGPESEEAEMLKGEESSWEVEGRDDDHECKIHVDGDTIFWAFGALGRTSFSGGIKTFFQWFFCILKIRK